MQEKAEKAQARKKKKRGLTSLVRAVSRTAGRFGDANLSQRISEVTYDIYDVSATASDLEQAAKDLGVSTEDVEACRNPVDREE